MTVRKGGALLCVLSTIAMLMSAPGAAEAADRKTRDIALGVGLGLLTGAIASQGDPRGAIGGAVAGGLIGAAISRDQHRRERRYEHRDGWRHDEGRGRSHRYHDYRRRD
jgi:hypothetical protein